jgi:hypothetical protein
MQRRHLKRLLMLRLLRGSNHYIAPNIESTHIDVEEGIGIVEIMTFLEIKHLEGFLILFV